MNEMNKSLFKYFIFLGNQWIEIIPKYHQDPGFIWGNPILIWKKHGFIWLNPVLIWQNHGFIWKTSQLQYAL